MINLNIPLYKKHEFPILKNDFQRLLYGILSVKMKDERLIKVFYKEFGNILTSQDLLNIS